MATPMRRDETSLLPRDLSTDQLAAAPTLATTDALLVEDLTELEDATPSSIDR